MPHWHNKRLESLNGSSDETTGAMPNSEECEHKFNVQETYLDCVGLIESLSREGRGRQNKAG